jgi:hypothetical protein
MMTNSGGLTRIPFTKAVLWIAFVAAFRATPALPGARNRVSSTIHSTSLQSIPVPGRAIRSRDS